MKLLLALVAFAGLTLATSQFATAAKGFHDYSVPSIDGKEVKFLEFKGHPVLVVNVASKCGFTPQYKGLQVLYEKYKSRGFLVLGFPSNDFRQQEPGSATEIKSFCQLNYGVTFPLFEKNKVTGADKQPLYQFLTENSPKGAEGEVGWNFEKFLVDGEGRVIGRWKSKVEPESPDIQGAIEKLLAKAGSK